MKIIILEGIATSGKTTIKNNLVKTFTEQGISFYVVEESETLMPVLDNQNLEKSLNHLEKTITKSLAEAKDFIIFDRLFFTHIFRTKSSIKDFQKIENLVKNNSLLVFLMIDEHKIPERIANTRIQRGKEWDEYVAKKGTLEEINQYYINQQRLLLGLLQETSINNRIYNTTGLDLENISKQILKDILTN